MAPRRPGAWAIAWIFLAAAFWPWQAHASLPRFEQPGWIALTPEQRAILAPLEKEWGEMDAFRRKKWIGIAQRFPEMTTTEQASMQRNMREWARMAPEERRIAREKYQTLRRVSPEERQFVRHKWEEYSQLADDEKERLRSKAPKISKVTTPAKPSAAAAAVQRIATPSVPAPKSPISPRKQPQNPLAPNLVVPIISITTPLPDPPAPESIE
jgi:hypothetical protein